MKLFEHTFQAHGSQEFEPKKNGHFELELKRFILFEAHAFTF
jgi:hypothetical protein